MKRQLAVIFVGWLICIATSAYAITLSYGATGPDVRSLQLRLIELAYDTVEVSGKFDMPTQAAVDAFRRQSGLAVSDGIDETTWNAVFAVDAPSREESSDTPDLVPGSTGDAVVALQARLLELGYFEGEFTPGIYDPETQYAQDRFCRQNEIALQSGATSALQTIILSNGAQAAPDDASALAESEDSFSIQAFLLTPISIMDIKLPMIFYCIMGLVLLAVIILLIIKIASRGNTSSRKAELGNKQALPISTGQSLSLQISFGDQEWQVQKSFSGLFSIGRAGDSLKLDSSDVGASRKHCDLYYQGNVIMLRDHSQSGTYLNGKRIHNSEAPVKPADIIQVSLHSITIEQ